MGETASLIVFYSLAAFIIAMCVLTVTTRKILHAATYMLFVLIGTAGIYLYLNYHFLAAVQLSVYAGGILVLFIFAIFLTSRKGEVFDKNRKRKVFYGITAAVSGIAVTMFALMKFNFMYVDESLIKGDQEINMKVIGNALMGTEKYQYLLPFEILSVLLLICIVGGIVIARKR